MAVAMLWSCNKEMQTSPAKKAVSMPAKGKTTLFSGDGSTDLAGYGYDVTGQYGNASAGRFQVIDIARLQHDYPGRVEIDNTTGQVGMLNSGQDASTYSSTLSAKLTATVGLKVFGGTLTASYTGTNTYSSNFVYSSYDLKVQEKEVKINAPASLLQNYLTASFVSDLQTQTPDYIISHYGTHILTDIMLGGKLEAIYQSETTSSNKTTAAEAGLSINVGKVFNLNTGVNYNSTATANNFGESLHYATYGGDPSKSLVGSIAIGSTTPPTVDISTWQSSCTPSNAQLVDIAQNGLISLSDLIADSTKSAAIKSAINTYLSNNQVNDIVTSTNTYPFPSWYSTKSWNYVYTMDPLTFTKIGINDNKPILTVGQAIYSPNGYYKLTLQQDGNMVLYRGNGSGSWTGIWDSQTVGKASNHVQYQSDCNLVIYNSSNQSMWGDNIYDVNGSIFRYSSYNLSTDNLPFFAMQNDGNLVEYWPAYTSDSHQFVYICFAATDTGQGNNSPHHGNLHTFTTAFRYAQGSYFVSQ